jgi:transposase
VIVAAFVVVIVVAPVAVAVHLNGNATVGVIGPQKLARIELAGSVPAMQRDFATVPDALWRRIEALIPTHARDPRGGRTRIPNRTVMSGIAYRLRTGCQWDAIPREFGSGSTCYRRFVEWQKAGVFHRIHVEMLRFYDDQRRIDWKWSALDSAIVKAPKGGISRDPTRPIGASGEPNAMS